MTANEKYNLLLFNQAIILILIFISRIYQKRTAEPFTHNRQSVRKSDYGTRLPIATRNRIE